MLLKAKFEFIKIPVFEGLIPHVVVVFVVVAFFAIMSLSLLQENGELLVVVFALLDGVLVLAVHVVKEEMGALVDVATVKLSTLNSSFVLFMVRDQSKRFAHLYRIFVPRATLQLVLLRSHLLPL
jgi:hypothetical protein